MKEEHTPEPWCHMAGMPTNVLGQSGLRVARCDFDGDFKHQEARANARRIVACVNACVGISTENLESDYQQGYDPWSHVKHLEKQRDDLLAEINNKSQQIAHLIDMLACFKSEINQCK